MAKYGLPYMGSKSGIADKLIPLLPKATHFYDLFGGGFSITHAMLVRRSKDFQHFHFNEIRPGICELIKDAIDGKYSYDNFKPPWVTREEFSIRLDSDPYIKMCWSFGNNGESYLFSKKIEPYKRSMHNAIVLNEFDDLAKEVLKMEKFRDGLSILDKRLFLRSKIEEYRKTTIPKVLHKFLNEQQLEQLEQLRQLERLTFSSKSYDEVEIKDDSVIYCDPPYTGTADYDGNTKFNHKSFLDWADAQKNPVFISEYQVNDKRFKKLFAIKKVSKLNLTRETKIENVYGNKMAVEIVWQQAIEAKKTKTQNISKRSKIG